ncbi:hypothetical protein AYO44_08845 [Planctomycetaceae bacterium SCGC AG-212-F19]|nr:hypothetical protein AYO44_08845 [Planctomycetaceae bacterium SCGC AG-212-F19]
MVFCCLLISGFGCLTVHLRAGDQTDRRVILEAVGYLVPVRQVTISPKVSGIVIEVMIDEGRVVQAGEVIARLDPAFYEAARDLAQAKLHRAQLLVKKAEAGANKEDVALAEADVSIAKAELRIAQTRLDGTIVRAPITGTVLTKKVEVGSMVNPTAASICEMADLRQLEVDVWVQEQDFAKVSIGQKCLIQVEASPKTQYQGRVARILPLVDRSKGAVGVRVRLDASKTMDTLRPEMRARVEFVQETK